MMTHASSKLNSIQLLRAIAVLLVVHLHTLGYQRLYTGHTFQDNFLRQGNIIVAQRVPLEAATTA